MSSAYNFNQDITYTLAKDVHEVCTPLFNSFHLNYFDYVRIYPDNTCLCLLSNNSWYKHFIESKYPFSGLSLTPGIHLWDNYIPEIAKRDSRTHFNLENGITIFTKNKNFIEYFDLAAPKQNYSVMDFYFNKLDMLNKFLFYFKSKANKLISKAEQNRIIITKTPSLTSNHAENFKIFNELLKSKKIGMNFRSIDVMFSPREYECLHYLSQGKTIKEVAKQLSISPRTVEYFLQVAKLKTKYTSTQKLLNDFLDNFIAITYEDL